MNEPLGIPTPGFNPASTDPDNNDLFFLELKYHDPYANLDVPAISRKSGDVSQLWWRARGRNREGYGLTYDYLGRMTKAQHVRLADGSSSTTPGAKIINNYSEQLEYADQRGNIARILRYGMNYTSGTQAGSGVIDDLQFITEPGYNRIQRINEQASDLVFKLKGFRPKTEANGSTSTGGIDYSYDANGNQTSDPHKGITSIQYNYLNLPVLISYADGRKIEQRYDAAGTLIFRWMTGDVTAPANNYFQTYIYGIEYRGSFMESVAHQEGRLFNTVNSTVNASWRYEYSISDHLGNTRLTFTDKATADGIIKVEDGEVLEEAHYYPFGLAMEGPWMNDVAALDTRYKFNGIERIQDFGLNVDMAMYRAYDPAIGRWWQADPIAKAWENPYAAMYNNPMNWSDFLGADPGKQDSLPTVEVRAKRTNKGEGDFWNSLYLTPFQYSSSDWDSYSSGSDSSPRDGKVAANAVINLWNGTVSTAHAVTHPAQAVQNVTAAIKGAYTYFGRTPLSQMGSDLANEENADELLSLGLASSLGLAKVKIPAIRSSLTILRTAKQLQAKFKHAIDFGVLGNYSRANAANFSRALHQHINSAAVKVISGKYRGKAAVHYLNPNTGLNVITSPTGEFISGWKLNPNQLKNVLKHGNL